MGHKIEQPTADRGFIAAPVIRPNLLRVPGGPFEMLRVVDGPAIRDVMARADEEIPLRHAGQLLDPVFAAGEIVALNAQPDRELRKGRPRLHDALKLAR